MNDKVISIPVHNNRISPLFDVSGKFILIKDRTPDLKTYVNTEGLSGISIIEKLKDLGVSTVICSAISAIYAQELYRRNIELIFGVIGSIDEIITAYYNNKLLSKRFAMPGCGRKRRMRGQCPYRRE